MSVPGPFCPEAHPRTPLAVAQAADRVVHVFHEKGARTLG